MGHMSELTGIEARLFSVGETSPLRSLRTNSRSRLVLENYTFLTLKTALLRPNVYADSRGVDLTRFSNSAENCFYNLRRTLASAFSLAHFAATRSPSWSICLPIVYPPNT